MVIFHSYVSLPEGNKYKVVPQFGIAKLVPVNPTMVTMVDISILTMGAPRCTQFDVVQNTILDYKHLKCHLP